MEKRLRVVASGAALFLGFLFLYSYSLTRTFSVNPDFARDVYDMQSIILGDFTLIGPKLSVGSFFAGPWYYYLLAPALLVSATPEAVLLLHAFICALLVTVGFILLQKKSMGMALAASITIGLWLWSTARWPWNGTAYLPWLFVTACFIYSKTHYSRISSLILGFLYGLIFSIHPASLLPLILLSLSFIRHRPKAVYFFSGIVCMMLPQLMFEVRNNFIMGRGIGQSTMHVYPYYFLGISLVCYLFLLRYKKIFIAASFAIALYSLSQIRLTPPLHPIDEFKTAVEKVLQDPRFNKKSFTVLHKNDSQMSVPVGHMYRFYFRKYGYSPLPLDVNAQQKIVFSQNRYSIEK